MNLKEISDYWNRDRLQIKHDCNNEFEQCYYIAYDSIMELIKIINNQQTQINKLQ
jgi:hypothetical protein